MLNSIATRPKFRPLEEGIKIALFLCASLSIVTTGFILWTLFSQAYPLFETVGLGEFLLGTEWTPILEPKHFGVLPLVAGTALIVAGSAVIAIPMGLACAVFLSEYASSGLRNVVKPLLEILAGIPTIVYGYLALTFVTPMLRNVLPGVEIFNALSASIVVGIMILPLVASLCDDALRAVPQSLRDGAYALGATTPEVSTRIAIPAALSGISASFVLAISRAIGETMAVTLAAGGRPNLTWNPLEGVQTMTAYIVQVSLGDTPQGGVESMTVFAVGALLFTLTLGMNLLARRFLRQFKETYE